MRHEEVGKRRYVTRLKPRCGWPEMTALVDVLFLTMIFVSLSSSFVKVSGIRVDLPQVSGSGTASMERFVVTIMPPEGGQPGKVYFNDQLMTAESLKQRFSELHDRSLTASVIIRADRRTGFAQLAEIMSLAQNARLSCFIAAAPPKQSKVTNFDQ